MKINPYLSFDGQCREAFTFYEQARRASRGRATVNAGQMVGD